MNDFMYVRIKPDHDPSSCVSHTFTFFSLYNKTFFVQNFFYSSFHLASMSGFTFAHFQVIMKINFV